ncbi:MAG TPA: ABC transporter substrate-binding protein [Candidatus Competibacteraceae bacterium]|nr:ABC transporter substrate-binding protein [Candidatus Competibacteraceae bacterium]
MSLRSPILSLFALWLCASAAAAETVRIGVLQFGTVQWELAVMQKEGLDTAQGIQVESVPLAGKDATAIALRGGQVDVIVTDWPWVSQQRHQGEPFTFVAHSLAAGALLVRPDAGIDGLAELSGKRLGVAGGALDKNWLLLRALAKRQGVSLPAPDFAAPPLLSELLLRGELPAVLTFWNFSARLEAAGMKPLLSVRQMLAALGMEEPVALLGWVFDEHWAKDHPQAITGLLRASRATKQRLLADDAVWETLRPLMKAENEAEFQALRAAYRAAIPAHVGPADAEPAARLFAVLAAEGGAELVGAQKALAPGTFWDGYRD